MPALKENKKYTIEDIMALPENEHAELIDGQIYYQAVNIRIYQVNCMQLSMIISREMVDNVRYIMLHLQYYLMMMILFILSLIFR